MERILKVAIAIAAMFLVALLAFIGGALWERAGRGILYGGVAADGGGDLPGLVTDVQGILRSQALEPSSAESMTTGALSGLVSSLDDPYAQYMSPADYDEFQMETEGEFFGVGMTIGSEDGTPTVVTVFKDTPAERAGMKAGDVIISIDGVRRDTWDVDDVVSRIRGPKGTQVALEIRRKGEARTRKVTITRDRVSIPNVMVAEMKGRDVGYIQLLQFNEHAGADVEKAVRELEGKGAKGFILDVRGNPGGLLSSSVEVSSLFIDSGVIVRIAERGKPEVQERASGGAITDRPMVLLVDGNSASASEILAGALKDYDRATLVGAKTFGKGSVQSVPPLDNGGAVKLTTAHYLTPKKRVINKKGVTPDVAVKMEPELIADPDKDVQLKKALEVLRKGL